VKICSREYSESGDFDRLEDSAVEKYILGLGVRNLTERGLLIRVTHPYTFQSDVYPGTGGFWGSK
jgi:hypothetical protein